jgi:hypothetical protein
MIPRMCVVRTERYKGQGTHVLSVVQFVHNNLRDDRVFAPSVSQVEGALQRNKSYLGRRYVEVFSAHKHVSAVRAYHICGHLHKDPPHCLQLLQLHCSYSFKAWTLCVARTAPETFAKIFSAVLQEYYAAVAQYMAEGGDGGPQQHYGGGGGGGRAMYDGRSGTELCTLPFCC